MRGLPGDVGYKLQLVFKDCLINKTVSSCCPIWTTRQNSVNKTMITDEDAKSAGGRAIYQRSHSSPGAEPGLLLDHLTFPCSIKAKNLRVVLGDQDLKKTEFHEQTFRVEKILKYSHYYERNDIPYNDIGKSLLAGISRGSCPGWISLLMES